MAFNLAGAVGANTEFLNAFQLSGPASGPVAARGQFPGLVVARNDSESSVPTVNMFIDGKSRSMKYAASIIDACAAQTTYALRCTSGPVYLGSSVCGANAPVITVTAGPATYRVSSATATRTASHDVSATLQETCELRGTTEAVCTATVGGSVDKTTTSASVTSTLSGTDYYRFDVAITGGAEKTASPTAECKPPPGSNSGASLKAAGVWGLVGSVVVSALLGFW
ncbi:hypothetical protein VTI74DRAFT_5599 [Chaetomium olivicolor]